MGPHIVYICFLRKWHMIVFRMLLLLPTIKVMIINIQEYNQLYIYMCNQFEYRSKNPKNNVYNISYMVPVLIK